MLFSTKLDAECAVSMLQSFARRHGCTVPQYEINEVGATLFEVVECGVILPV